MSFDLTRRGALAGMAAAPLVLGAAPALAASAPAVPSPTLNELAARS